MLDDPNKLIQSHFEGPNNGSVKWREEAKALAQHLGKVAIENLPDTDKYTRLISGCLRLG